MMVILSRKVTGWLLAAVLVGFFFAGFWPFSVDLPNRASWLTKGTGLHFERRSIAYDPQPLPEITPAASLDQPAIFTLELWLTPDWEPARNVFNILTIYDGSLPSNLVLCQWKSALLLRFASPGSPRRFREEGLTNVLHRRQPQFVTLVGSASGTALYLEGHLAERFPEFKIPARRLRGQLILGDEASGKHSWSGQILGLALFDRALEADAIARDYATWTNHAANRLRNKRGLAALYLFDEKEGTVAHDRSPHQHVLLVPPRYQVLHRVILGTPWGDLPIERSDQRDIVVNILGFLPFGFLLFHYLCLKMPRLGLVNLALTMFAGTAVSLIIELVQVWMPGRYSSATDVATNTLGAILGGLVALKLGQRARSSDAKSNQARETLEG